MLRARIDLELQQLLPREPVLREHSLDRLAQHLGRPPLELLAQRTHLQAARVARMPIDHLLVELLAGDLDLLGVDDDDEVAGVDVRRVLRRALAAQLVRDLSSQTAEGLALGIDDVPASLDLARLCVVGLHLTRKEGGQPVRRRRSVATMNRPFEAPEPALWAV